MRRGIGKDLKLQERGLLTEEKRLMLYIVMKRREEVEKRGSARLENKARRPNLRVSDSNNEHPVEDQNLH